MNEQKLRTDRDTGTRVHCNHVSIGAYTLAVRVRAWRRVVARAVHGTAVICCWRVKLFNPIYASEPRQNARGMRTVARNIRARLPGRIVPRVASCRRRAPRRAPAITQILSLEMTARVARPRQRATFISRFTEFDIPRSRVAFSFLSLSLSFF